MATAATQSTSLIAFTLPSTPYSVQMARFYLRAALTHYQLSEYAEDGATIASELVTNAIQHSGSQQVGLEVRHHPDSEAVAVILADTSFSPPVRRDPSGGAEHGHGLNIVDALSASWGWQLEDHGKAVFATLTRRAEPVETISDLPMLHDIDADYSPQYVKLARIVRVKIESGHYEHGDPIPAADLAGEHGVSVRVARSALAMPTANRYVTHSADFRPYHVTWEAKA